MPGLGAAATAPYADALLAERSDEPHEDQPGADPDEEPGEEVVQQHSKTQADKDPADEGRPAVGVASSWVSSRSYCVHRPSS